MATYRIGQRCKMVNCENAPNPRARECNGDEVGILGLPGMDEDFPNDYEITRPAHLRGGGERFFSPPHYLTPLLDPRADEFIARLEKLGREPVIQPVTVEGER
jgi:hypothetical protein